ncbi:hypothetical protein [Klebsiella aerogenes]|uniref:hypothetical protein n=1 Tax=Klebsiella aerogenes TaxID=548 RepID=UPI002413AE31|nr:hypothetical protein [Klebsiella aerogenes]MDG4539496.1 hypothetical protein [Klebsiella aerogenes]
MTKSTITRERIQRIIRAIDSEAYDEEEIREWLSSDEIMELARMALAAMDSEPIYQYRIRNGYNGQVTEWQTIRPDQVDFVIKAQPINAEFRIIAAQQPAPVVSADLLHTAASAIEDLLTTKDRTGAGVWFDLPFQLRSAANAQQALVVPEGVRHALSKMDDEITAELNAEESAYRAAMLQAGNSPVIPDGYVMVPVRLTAENGAKWELSGEFSETKFVNCPECFGDDECETCDGSGRIGITVPVTWTTIKEIWAKGVEHFAAAPQEVKGE